MKFNIEIFSLYIIIGDYMHCMNLINSAVTQAQYINSLVQFNSIIRCKYNE